MLDHLAIPLRTFTFFGYGSYKLTDTISASLRTQLRQILFGK